MNLVGLWPPPLVEEGAELDLFLCLLFPIDMLRVRRKCNKLIGERIKYKGPSCKCRKSSALLPRVK